jgi:hypothetical protein
MDKLHGTPNTTNCGSPYTTSFSLFFNAFEVCSSMNSFTLDTFVFDIFEHYKIIICSFIVYKIQVDIFKLCKSFRCSKRSITFLKEAISYHIPTKIQFLLQGPLHFGQSCHISMYCFIVHQLVLTHLSSGKGQCVLQKLLSFRSVVILRMYKLCWKTISSK